MPYRFSFRIYRRSFKQPLQTHHGRWSIREGILLRLVDGDRRVGFGEIAPLPWFGSETLAQALSFCQQLGDEIALETIFSIPTAEDRGCPLPACRFGFESALASMTDPLRFQSNPPSAFKMSYSGLLPAGKVALTAWNPLWQQGYRTFKWKIGVAPLPQELLLFDRLTQILSAKAAETGSAVSLRLDANGGLSLAVAEQWLQRCDRIQLPPIANRPREAGSKQSTLSSSGSFRVEFLEQPLPVDRFDAMLALSQHATPLALDESVSTVSQLEHCYQQGWRGVFVVKPAIAGSPARLRQFCQTHAIDLVFSSVFETAIGRQAVLNLAAEIWDAQSIDAEQGSTASSIPREPQYDSSTARPSASAVPQNLRALGFGIDHWFCEDDDLDSQDPEHLWQSL